MKNDHFSSKYVCAGAAMHLQYHNTYREKIKMFTIKLFEGWLRGLARRPADKDLEAWARIEYKKDSSFAYYHMKEFGVAPNVGVNL